MLIYLHSSTSFKSRAFLNSFTESLDHPSPCQQDEKDTDSFCRYFLFYYIPYEFRWLKITGTKNIFPFKSMSIVNMGCSIFCVTISLSCTRQTEYCYFAPTIEYVFRQHSMNKHYFLLFLHLFISFHFIYLTSNNYYIRTTGQVKYNNDEKTSSQI
jgi:hypothetical protein